MVNITAKSMDMKKSIIKYERPVYVLVFLLCGFFCFHRLGTQSIELWDEARHGVNAYEMLHSNSFIVNTYLYLPDYYNLKPPLSMYGAILGYLIWGFNALGLRFFAAVSYFLTALTVSLYARKRYGKLSSWFVLFAFFAAEGMLCNHMARNGDADAYLGLFITLSCILFIIGYRNRRLWYIFGAGVSFGLAFLAKGFAGMIIPMIILTFLLFELMRKEKLPSDILKKLIIMGVTAFFIIGIWVVFRYHADGTTFLLQTFLTDVWERSTNRIAGYEMSWDFYLINNSRSGARWMVFSVFLTAMGIWIYQGKKSEVKNTSDEQEIPFFLVWTLLPIFFYTLCKTKLDWYVYPAYIGGICLGAACIGYLRKMNIKLWLCYMLTVIVILFAIKGIYCNYLTITEKPTNGFNTFLKEASTIVPNGVNIYMDVNRDSGMNAVQGYVLLFEWYFDAKFQTSGREGFMSDENGYYFEFLYGKDKTELIPGTKVIHEADQYRIIGHR